MCEKPQFKYRHHENLPTPAEQPAFKPGNRPYLQFGNIVLNNNLPWKEITCDVLDGATLTRTELAERLEMPLNQFDFIVNGNSCPLTFKQGARLLTLQERYAPEMI